MTQTFVSAIADKLALLRKRRSEDFLQICVQRKAGPRSASDEPRPPPSSSIRCLQSRDKPATRPWLVALRHRSSADRRSITQASQPANPTRADARTRGQPPPMTHRRDTQTEGPRWHLCRAHSSLSLRGQHRRREAQRPEPRPAMKNSVLLLLLLAAAALLLLSQNK